MFKKFSKKFSIVDVLYGGGFLVDVTKRSGDRQQFDRKKLKNSIKKAGALDREAEKITSKIEDRVMDGTSTGTIRGWVSTELSANTAKDVAKNYNSYKKQKTAIPMQH
jgi:transcriptional regulator NrdR family protein